MFVILSVFAILVGVGAFFAFISNNKGLGICAVVAALIVFIFAWTPRQGEVYWAQLVASGKSGNWLVVDNSGGETLRHWILEDSYVASSDQSDGWKFHDAEGNLCYVSGDAFVMRIGQPLAKFQETYKKEYNIPVEQEALH